jgi:hypothetical protein
MKLSEYKRMIREASSDYEALQACEDAEDDPDITMDQKYLLDEYFMKKWPNFGREAYELADEFSGWGLSED